jgi:hypothetical protein
MLDAVVLQTALAGFEFREAAAFLLHQIEFDASYVFRGLENICPICRAFAE